MYNVYMILFLIINVLLIHILDISQENYVFSDSGDFSVIKIHTFPNCLKTRVQYNCNSLYTIIS